MKHGWMLALGIAGAVAARGQAPLRVAVLEFQDRTGRAPGTVQAEIPPGDLAAKGVFVLGKALANQPGYVLIDRRDLLGRYENAPAAGAADGDARPSFLQAAQALRADAVLRGSLLSLSSGRQVINQGGHQSEHTTLSVRVGLEALDATDGAIIAVADGVARQALRQTSAVQTVLGEDALLELLEQAVAEAVPGLSKALAARAEQRKQRPTVKLAIRTTADPALVEIDGLLVGTTPVEEIEVYRGDHVITVGKPGHQQVTKRILFEKDTRLEVPLLREKMTIEELKEIYEKIQLKVIQVDPGVILHAWE